MDSNARGMMISLQCAPPLQSLALRRCHVWQSVKDEVVQLNSISEHFTFTDPENGGMCEAEDDVVSENAPELDFGSALRDDVVRVLDFLRHEKRVHARVCWSVLSLANNMRRARTHALDALRARLAEVDLQLRDERQRQIDNRDRERDRERRQSDVLLPEHFHREVYATNTVAATHRDRQRDRDTDTDRQRGKQIHAERAKDKDKDKRGLTRTNRETNKENRKAVHTEEQKALPVPIPMPSWAVHRYTLTRRESVEHHRQMTSTFASSSSAAWQGSEYKLQLLSSLRDKLLMKVLFEGWRVFVHGQLIVRQTTVQSCTLKTKHMMQLCFTAIIFEGLTTVFIAHNSEGRTTKYLQQPHHKNGVRRRHLIHAISRLRLFAWERHQYKAGRAYDQRKYLTIGIKMLREETEILQRKRLLMEWSKYSFESTLKMKIFFVWCLAIIKKENLRVRIMKKFQDSSSQSMLLETTVDVDNKAASCPSIWKLIDEHRRTQLYALENILKSMRGRMRSSKPYGASLGAPVVGGRKSFQILANELQFQDSKRLLDSEGRRSISDKVHEIELNELRNSFRITLQDAIVAKKAFNKLDKVRHVRNGASNFFLSECSSVSSGGNKEGDRFENSRFLWERDDHVDGADVSVLNRLNLSKQTTESLIHLSTPKRSVISIAVTASPHGVFSENDSDLDHDDPNERAVKLDDIKMSFQLAKIRWFVAKSLQFIRYLQRMVRIHKNRMLLKQHHEHQVMRAVFPAWLAVFLKFETQNTLCDKIHEFRLKLNMFQQWSSFLANKFCKRKAIIGVWKERRSRLTFFRCWASEFKARRRYKWAVQTLAFNKERRFLSAWKQTINVEKKLRLKVLIILRSRTSPLFMDWKEKYQRRSLLRRVFTLHDRAWYLRTAFPSTDFALSYKVFSAWASYSRLRRQEKRDLRNHHVALFFRGASLLAWTFIAWKDVTAFQRSVSNMVVKYDRLLLTQTMKRWKQYIFQTMVAVENDTASILQHFRKRRLWRWWRNVVLDRQVRIPATYRNHSIVKKSLNSWKFLHRMSALENVLVPRIAFNCLVKAWFGWRFSFFQNVRFSKGLLVWDSWHWRVKVRLAFQAWPGYSQFRRLHDRLKQRDIDQKGLEGSNVDGGLQQIKKKKRMKMKIVDNVEDLEGIERWRKTREEQRLLSLIKKKIPRLPELALAKGFLSFLPDPEGEEEILLLMTTVLNCWKRYIRFHNQMRYLSNCVSGAVNQRIQLKVMMKWIALTPVIAYRVITWMHNKRTAPKGDVVYDVIRKVGELRDLRRIDYDDYEEEAEDEKEANRYNKFLRFKNNSSDGSIFYTAGHMMAYKLLKESKRKFHSRSYDNDA